MKSDKKQADRARLRPAQNTNKRTLSGRVSTTSVDRITPAGQCDDVSFCDRKSQMQIAESQKLQQPMMQRRVKRPCGPLATFVITYDCVPATMTRVSYSLREAKDIKVLRPSSKEKNAFAVLATARVLSFEKVIGGQGVSPLRQTPSAYSQEG